MGATAAAAQAVVINQADRAASPSAQTPEGYFGGRRVSLDCTGLFRSCWRSDRNGHQEQTDGRASPEVRQPRALSARESHGSVRDSRSGDESSPVPPKTLSPTPAAASVLHGPLQPGGSDSGAGVAGSGTVTAAKDPDFLSTEVPWLTPMLNADRLSTNQALGNPQRRERPVQAWEKLRGPFEQTIGIEKDLLEADALLEKSRTALLNESESRRLREIVAHYKDAAPRLMEQLGTMLLPLADDNDIDAHSGWLALDLLRRSESALEHFMRREWEEPRKVVKLELPIGEPRNLEVESRVVCGSELASHFPNGYPPCYGAESYEAPFFKHVPGLGHTSATNARGEVVYSGLCHDLVALGLLRSSAVLVASERMDDAPNEWLTDCIRECVKAKGNSELAGVTPDELTETLAAQVRALHRPALRFVDTHLRDVTARKMAEEITLAALVTDPSKLKRALAGEVVEVNLCWVADLLGVGERMDSFLPFKAAVGMAESSPVELSVRTADGAVQTVKVDFKCRRFVFTIPNAIWGNAFRPSEAEEVLESSWVKLLGPRGFGLGGDAKASVDAMEVRIRELRDEIARLDQEPCRVSAQGRLHSADSAATSAERSAMNAELGRLEKKRHTLLSVGERLISFADCWRQIRFGPPEEQGPKYPQTLSMLALAGHLMGETPVLVRKGNNGVKDLDANVKFLAAVADRGHGLPPLGRDAAWKECAKSFSAQVAPQAGRLVNPEALRQQRLLSELSVRMY